MKSGNLNHTQFFEGLEEEDIQSILDLPLQDRMKQLALVRKVPEEEALKTCAAATGLPILEHFDVQIEGDEDPFQNPPIPLRLIHEFQALPLPDPDEKSEEEEVDSNGNGNRKPARRGELKLVAAWPPEPSMDKWVFAVSGLKPKWFLGPAERVANTITQHYGVGSGSLENSDLGFEDTDTDIEEAEDQNAAIIRFVNEVIQKAITDRATDIHFEPHKDTLQIRYRIDGELVPIRVPDNLIHFQGAIISRLKIMSKLNISEKRRPQDGRINWSSGSNALDIRLSTFPTMYGESISLRLLNNKSQPMSVQELGFLPEDETMVNASLARPYGIILVTGPTGSGKSTSLTAFIRRINQPERRIITVEDPVEYEVPGVNQTQVKHEIGLNFAAALRHILRQDPDVIMVGEIRDRETADIAIRASLTGHLVLSTIHTNDAPGALTRLIDMDIEPFLIASSVELIIAQRLVRRLCEYCARPSTLNTGYLESCLAALRLPPSEVQYEHLVKEPVGCERCRGFGYQGRVGIFELLRISDEIHQMVVQKASARDIRTKALAEGMLTLQRSGWEQVKRGITSLPEIMRFAELAENGQDNQKPAT